MQTLRAIVVIATVYGVLPSSGRPSGDSSNHFESISHMTSSNSGYSVSLSQTDVNGKCTAKLVIQGNGISKSIDYPCRSTPENVINLNNTLLVGKDYFSDTPNVLVHLLGGGKCEKEVFEKKDGQFTSKVEPMDDKECQQIDVKIGQLKEEQEKWNKWAEDQKKKTQQQIEQMQQNLQQTLKNMGNFFGGFRGFPTFGI